MKLVMRVLHPVYHPIDSPSHHLDPIRLRSIVQWGPFYYFSMYKTAACDHLAVVVNQKIPPWLLLESLVKMGSLG
jgi:hypothetical protein